jgi:tRNA pseudouridine13 synthase
VSVYAHGGPGLRGRIKVAPEDFVVIETLGFEPEGQGEHDLLLIEKRGVNTEWLARQLARYAGVAPVAIGYAGLKDRHAVTRQHFSVQLPGRTIDWGNLAIQGVRVLHRTRHSRKLQRGALKGNRFELRVRGIAGDRERASRQLAAIARAGFPNRFGEQRFGHDEGNLDLARRLFAGARLKRSERGFAISAARSAIFNAVLDARVGDGSWNQPRDGDLMQLDGRSAFFGPIEADAVLTGRCERGEIHPTGPLWGAGPPATAGEVRALEIELAAQFEGFSEGLVAVGAEHERRALRAMARELAWSFEGDDLLLSFRLPAGAYATALLAEVIRGD